MTQRGALYDDQKKLNWLLGLEKETLANMAHQQSKIIEKLQKAAKAQAVPCQNVNEAINNPMPRGYMLNMLVKFQKWRIGEDVRTLDETGLTPRLITLAIDWAIEQLDKSKAQAVSKANKDLLQSLRDMVEIVGANFCSSQDVKLKYKIARELLEQNK